MMHGRSWGIKDGDGREYCKIFCFFLPSPLQPSFSPLSPNQQLRYFVVLGDCGCGRLSIDGKMISSQVFPQFLFTLNFDMKDLSCEPSSGFSAPR